MYACMHVCERKAPLPSSPHVGVIPQVCLRIISYFGDDLWLGKGGGRDKALAVGEWVSE